MPEHTDVAALRAALGITQEVAARMAGVSLATFRNWEHGRTAPASLAHRRALAKLRRRAEKMEEAK